MTPFSKIRLFTLFLLSVGTEARLQNLVPNPSFEIYSSCPDFMSQITLSGPWNRPANHLGTPDYYNACGPASGGQGVPSNVLGDEPAADGNAYVGLALKGGPEEREYIQVQLTSPLAAGNIYHVSFKCSMADVPFFEPPVPASVNTNALGIYLSAAPVSLPTPIASSIPVTPQYSPWFTIAKNGWTTLSFDYTATGGEQYILIGNFRTDANTNMTPQTQTLYTYIDEVYVACASGICITGETQICLGESTTLTGTNNSTYAWAAAAAPGTVIGNGASITVTPNDTTTYYLYGDNNDTGIVTVFVTPVPIVNLGNDTVLCAGDNLLLVAYQGNAHVSGTQYVWQNGSTEPFFTPTQTGTYSVTASLHGCSTSDTIHVIMNPVPHVNLGPDIELCPGQTVTLNAATPNATYLWQDNSTAATFFVDAAGTYRVTASIGNCTDADTVTVTDAPNPAVNLGNDITLCNGDPLTLDATVQNATYQWQNNSTGATFTPTQTGTYWVRVTLGPCTAGDTVDVVFNPLPAVDLGSDLTPCIGNTVTLDATQPGSSYRWHDDTNTATYTVTQSGTYGVQVTDANGCKNSDAVTVTFILPPVVDFADSTLCLGDVWELNITASFATYLWQDKSTLPTFTVMRPGTYWATATNGCGSDGDTMQIDYRRCNCDLYIPDSFTPDQSGTNETLRILANPECDLAQYTLSIFDRWGQLIFETQNIEFDWDGNLKGKPVPPGIYAYRLSYKFDKTPQKLGWGMICLIR